MRAHHSMVTRPLQFNGLLFALGKLWSCDFAVSRPSGAGETSGRRVARSSCHGAEKKHRNGGGKIDWVVSEKLKAEGTRGCTRQVMQIG